jgi:DNA-binding Lrp family transcriptional regulator
LNLQNTQAILGLFDAIKSHGLENVRVLAESAKIPLETARYMTWHEFPKHLISYDVVIDYEALGLGRWILEFTPASTISGAKFQNGILGNGTGVIYSGKVIPENSYVAILAIPFREQYKLYVEMENLIKLGIIENYSLSEIRKFRSLSFNPQFYRFRDRRWNFSWKDVEIYQRKAKNLDIPSNKKQRNDGLMLDYKDLLILKEFQRRIPKSISKLAKRIGLDPYNIRYHYNEHARRVILGYRLKVIPDSMSRRSSFIFVFTPTDVKNDGFETARSIASSLPFTDSVWETEKEYYWSASCPGEFSNELLRFTSNKFGNIRGKLRSITLDSTSEFQGTIPYQFYDGNARKWSYSPKISSGKPNASFQELRDTCKYEVGNRCFFNETDPQNCTVSSCQFAIHGN